MNDAADPAVGSDEITLTLITPCLNAAATIGDTLDSVVALGSRLSSRGLTVEHLIVDGGSDDGTLQLIEAYQGQGACCSLIKSVNGGPYPAMNAGLANARGIYSHILNADDMIWDVDVYAALICQALEVNAHFILGSIVYFRRPEKRILSRWLVDALPEDRQLWKAQLRNGLHYPHPGFLCRTDLYRTTPFDISYAYSADYKLMQSLLLSATPSTRICTSSAPIVAMARGGITGQWQSIVKAQSELRKINRELGIQAPAWRRYRGKIISRYLKPWLQRLRPARHQG